MLTSKIFCGILFCMNTNKNTDNEMMNTQVKKVDAMHPDMDIMREAGEIIRQGGLVGFPTETVYGLGADALLPEGAKRIYAAKGRPSDNPLIVHIADFEALKKITSYIPPQAKALADAFWPGPLTMIFQKSDAVPYETTGGLDTVAVRMPSHPTGGWRLYRCAEREYLRTAESDAGRACIRGSEGENSDDPGWRSSWHRH